MRKHSGARQDHRVAGGVAAPQAPQVLPAPQVLQVAGEAGGHLVHPEAGGVVVRLVLRARGEVVDHLDHPDHPVRPVRPVHPVVADTVYPGEVVVPLVPPVPPVPRVHPAHRARMVPMDRLVLPVPMVAGAIAVRRTIITRVVAELAMLRQPRRRITRSP